MEMVLLDVYLWKKCVPIWKGYMCTYGRDAREGKGCVPIEGRDVHVPMEERDNVYYIGTHILS